jgi:hypothetical protein
VIARVVILCCVDVLFATGCSSAEPASGFVSSLDERFLVFVTCLFLDSMFSGLDDSTCESGAVSVFTCVDDRVTRLFGSGAGSEVWRLFGGILGHLSVSSWVLP